MSQATINHVGTHMYFRSTPANQSNKLIPTHGYPSGIFQQPTI